MGPLKSVIPLPIKRTLEVYGNSKLCSGTFPAGYFKKSHENQVIAKGAHHSWLKRVPFRYFAPVLTMTISWGQWVILQFDVTMARLKAEYSVDAGLRACGPIPLPGGSPVTMQR